jgi:hypothetical protein
MTIAVHFAHWWLYVLAALGGFIVGNLVCIAAVMFSLGRGMDW